MKRKGMTLKRILAPLSHDEELQRDEWIPAFAGMTARESSDNNENAATIASSATTARAL